VNCEKKQKGGFFMKHRLEVSKY